MRSFLLPVFLFLFSCSLTAQSDYCGFDRIQKGRSISELKIAEQVDGMIYDHIRLVDHSGSKSPGTVQTIPVVFHVIHQNGPENIPDSTIDSLLIVLNLRFQNLAPYYDPDGVATNIQFCRATVDPLGRPATGITRDTSVYTDVSYVGPYTNEILMKNINRWNPQLYLNIWLVRSIYPTATAYSSYPASVGAPEDGIVAVAPHVAIHTELLTHEVGHYLGLYHTFENSSPCRNFNCMLDGDQVCDTPPDTQIFGDCPFNSCNTDLDDTTGFNPFTTDVDDLPNYMDYTLCPHSFTQGQSDRMNATLSLIRYNLLLSNGCGAHPGGPVPSADFTHSLSCEGETFFNMSSNSLCAEWDFENDGKYDGIGDTVNHVYPASGTYTIKMRATGFGGGDSAMYTHYIAVRPDKDYPILYHTGYSFSPYNGQQYSCYGNPVTLYGFPSMASYHWSNGDTTQNITFIADSAFDISLTTIDTSGYSWTSCPTPIHVAVAPPLSKPQVYSLDPDSVCMNDSIHFHVSPDPGVYVYGWFHSEMNYLTDTLFSTTALGWNDFVYATVRDVNGCRLNSDTSFVYADSVVAQPYQMTQNGYMLFGKTNWNNLFYMNGQPMPWATEDHYLVTQPGCYSVESWHKFRECAVLSDTICFLVVGGDVFGHSDRFSVNPNPANEAAWLKGNLSNPATFSLVTLMGQEVMNLNLRKGRLSKLVPIINLEAGLYFWILKTNSGVSSSGKILIMH